MDMFDYADPPKRLDPPIIHRNLTSVTDKALFDHVMALPLRLAGERWSLESHIATETISGKKRAERIIEEYRRFIYLLALSDHTLALPPLLRAVCALQFKNTQAGLAELVGPLTSNAPILVLSVLSRGFSAAYRETLLLYRKEFGDEPFKKVWPSPLGVQIYSWWNYVASFWLGTAFLSVPIAVLSNRAEILAFMGIGLIFGVPMIMLPSFVGPWGLYYPGD